MVPLQGAAARCWCQGTVCILELGCWCSCRGAAARCCCQSAVCALELGCCRVPLQGAAVRVPFALSSLVAGALQGAAAECHCWCCCGGKLRQVLSRAQGFFSFSLLAFRSKRALVGWYAFKSRSGCVSFCSFMLRLRWCCVQHKQHRQQKQHKQQKEQRTSSSTSSSTSSWWCSLCCFCCSCCLCCWCCFCCFCCRCFGAARAASAAAAPAASAASAAAGSDRRRVATLRP